MHRVGFLILTMLPLSSFLFAQGPGGAPSFPPEFIDGTKTPDRIPDQAAFRLVFLSLSGAATADQKGPARQEALLQKIGLSDVDKATLKTAMTTFATNHASWHHSVATNGNASPELIAEGWAIVQATRDVLTKKLTTDGNTKIIQYVTRAKTHMRVRP